MFYKEDITNLKTNIHDKIGQKIRIKGTTGRSKFFTKEATIEGTYPSLFIVKYEDEGRNVTYSYTDVLTKTVEVDVFDGHDYNPLIPLSIQGGK